MTDYECYMIVMRGHWYAAKWVLGISIILLLIGLVAKAWYDMYDKNIKEKEHKELLKKKIDPNNKD